MSWTDDACAGGFAYQVLNHRVVAEIQRKVTTMGGTWGWISQAFDTKDDRVIAAWRWDLSKILHVFNVRYDVFARP